ncbi:GumC family protein [Devosia aquimaris]|uniref:GumC family protein n=1 Tax=Devosia aquimaris TaxID=2866214 RepID=UPI001CD08C25|nr:GumC family protein [Devosia sp. CJK-A8-3]
MTYESSAARDARIDVSAVLGAVIARLPRIIIVTLVLLALAFVAMMFMPRLYESSASILVEPRSNVYTRSANEQAPTTNGNETGVVSSQIELIKSRDTLLKVIDQLDLRSVPEFNGSGGGGFSPIGVISNLLGRKSTPVSIDETVLDNLLGRMTVIQERDSRIISVLVRSQDPQLAADIANAVAYAHVTRRAQLSISDTAEASGWLLDEIGRLRVSVKEAETAVADYKVKNDLFTGPNNTSLIDQQLSTIAGQINAAQERRNQAASRATLIRGMLDRGQSIEGVSDVRDSAVIQNLSEEKARLRSEMAQKAATLLPSHPTMRAINAQIAELDAQIAAEGRRVADALEAEAQIEGDLEASLKADLARTKTSASTATQDGVTLDGLQREAKAQRDLLEAYLLRYNEAFSKTEANSALPDVRVVSEAAPSVVPASPKTQMILLAVGIVALAGQVGLVVFGELISGRAIIAAAEPQRNLDELESEPFSVAELEPEQRWEEPVAVDVEAEDLPAVEAETSYLAPVVPDVELDPEMAIEPEAAVDEEAEPEPESYRIDADPIMARPESAATPARESSAFIKALANEFGRPAAAVDTIVPAESQTVAAAPAEPRTAPPAAAASLPKLTGLISKDDLASDLMLGRTHLVVLAAHNANDDCEALAEELVGDALGRGLSVALVDAGSARPSQELGLTDLSTDAASFGDVVHKSADNSFAEIPWGRGRAIARHSSKPFTLIEALGDIYEVVVLKTGKVGLASTLPLFQGLDGRIVLIAGPDDDLTAVSDTREQLYDAGFEAVEIAALDSRVAA